MKTLSQQIRSERRTKMLREAISTTGYLIALSTAILLADALAWASCALSDVCYLTNTL